MRFYIITFFLFLELTTSAKCLSTLEDWNRETQTKYPIGNQVYVVSEPGHIRFAIGKRVYSASDFSRYLPTWIQDYANTPITKIYIQVSEKELTQLKEYFDAHPQGGYNCATSVCDILSRNLGITVPPPPFNLSPLLVHTWLVASGKIPGSRIGRIEHQPSATPYVDHSEFRSREIIGIVFAGLLVGVPLTLYFTINDDDKNKTHKDQTLEKKSKEKLKSPIQINSDPVLLPSE